MRVESASNSWMAKPLEQPGANLFKKTYNDSSPASIMIGVRALVNFSASDAASRNIENGMSYLQTAASHTSKIEDVLSQLNGLAVRAADGTLTDSDRSAINAQAKEYLAMIDEWVKSANFNGRKTLQGGKVETTIDGQGGMLALEPPNASRSYLGIDNIDLSSFEGAQDAIGKLGGAVDKLATENVRVGSQLNRMDKTFQALLDSEANTLETGSRLTDADMARRMTSWAAEGIGAQAATMVMAQGQKLAVSMGNASLL